jgi:hypothetical protein
MIFKWFITLALMLSLSHGGECTVRQYGQPPIPEGASEPYTSKEELFSLMIPQGWSKMESDFPYQDPKAKTTGLRLSIPSDHDDIETEIAVIYYEYGGFFNHYREYVEKKQNSFVRVDRDSKMDLSATTVNGKEGHAFQIRTFEAAVKPGWVPPPFEEGVVYELYPPVTRVNMMEKFIVVPAVQGFFVLHYKSPEEQADACQGVFERTVQSLRFIGSEPWQGER